MVDPARESSIFSLYYMPEIDENNGIQSKPFSQMNSLKTGTQKVECGIFHRVFKYNLKILQKRVRLKTRTIYIG